MRGFLVFPRTIIPLSLRTIAIVKIAGNKSKPCKPRFYCATSSGLPLSGKMPRKRAVSFAGFFSKLLPSHRPEQGRTLRDENHRGDSAYLDLGIKPEELTAWNVAEDISPHRRAELTLQAQERVASPGPQVSTLNLGKANIRRRPLSSSQTHALLRSKEKSRQDRRELKASGDFLPVTGCDPWTGEWDVLTPTETLSSDTTSPSVDDQMAKLARDVHEAKKAYDRAKSEQDSATEKASLLKAEARLAKIEKKKSELKQQKRVIRWSRHRKHWSSAAEPVLSPIAQSMNSSEFTPLPSTISDTDNH